MNRLTHPATADLTTATSVAQMASIEQFPPDVYAICLSETIRSTNVPLDAHRERLFKLSQLANGLAGDQTTADDLAAHGLILEALFHSFARQAGEALKSTSHRAPDIAEKFLSSALKAQKAHMAVLGAIKVIRDQHTTPTTAVTQPAPAQALGAK